MQSNFELNKKIVPLFISHLAMYYTIHCIDAITIWNFQLYAYPTVLKFGLFNTALLAAQDNLVSAYLHGAVNRIKSWYGQRW